MFEKLPIRYLICFIVFCSDDSDVVIVEDEKENVVKMKAKGTGGRSRGRGCGHGKAASTSLPRLGKAKQEVIALKEEEIKKPEGKTEKKEKNEKKTKACRRTRSTGTDSDKEARLNLAKQCKEKADELRGKPVDSTSKGARSELHHH